MATTTTSTQAPTQPTTAPQGGGCGGGCIAGIIIGFLIVLLIVVVIIAIIPCYWNKKRSKLLFSLRKISVEFCNKNRTEGIITRNGATKNSNVSHNYVS